MKFSKMICFALLASMPVAALATRASSIPLAGGSALPGQIVSISGDGLYESTFYNLRCIVRMQSKSGEKSSHIRVEAHSTGSVEVNSDSLSEYRQARIDVNENNYLDVHEFRDFTDVEIVNLDRDNSLTVSDCVATPSVY